MIQVVVGPCAERRRETTPRTNRIAVNPKVMLGKPVIRGTRIPVKFILRKLSEGASEADLLDAYPRLKRGDIQAALSCAADDAGGGRSAGRAARRAAGGLFCGRATGPRTDQSPDREVRP